VFHDIPTLLLILLEEKIETDEKTIRRNRPWETDVRTKNNQSKRKGDWMERKNNDTGKKQTVCKTSVERPRCNGCMYACIHNGIRDGEEGTL